MKKGKFIVIEGPDGAGKTGAVQELVSDLRTLGINNVVTFREPGGTWVGEKIRPILLEKEAEKISPTTELLLFTAARSQLINKIRSELEAGNHVIIDRFWFSTVAYQIFRTQRFDLLPWLMDTTMMVCGDLYRPDLTIFLDVEPGVGLKRSASRRGNTETRFEDEGLQSAERVRDGFLTLVNSQRLGYFPASINSELGASLNDFADFSEHTSDAAQAHSDFICSNFSDIPLWDNEKAIELEKAINDEWNFRRESGDLCAQSNDFETYMINTTNRTEKDVQGLILGALIDLNIIDYKIVK